MKTLRNLFFLAAICLFFTACQTKRQVVKNAETTTNQIIESKTSYRDTVFYTPKTETSLKLPISELKKCPETPFKQPLNTVLENEKPKIYTQKNGNAKATVKIVHDSIFIKAECDSVALEAKIRSDLYRENLNKSSNSSESEKVKTGLSFFEILGIVLIALIFGFVSGKLIKI